MMCAAGAKVVDNTNTKGSTQTRKKLQDGVTDVVWEYTGTGWINYLGHDKPITDPQKQYAAVKKEDLAKNKLVWGPLAPFNNTYAFAVTDEFGKKNNLKTHSDMAAYIKKNPSATVCVESEFAARPDGYPGFKKTYGITGGKLKSLGTGVVYTQLDKGNCDFGEIFTTDGRLAALGLQVLDDDKGYFPLYNGVAVTRADFDKQHPEMLKVLEPLADVPDHRRDDQPEQEEELRRGGPGQDRRGLPEGEGLPQVAPRTLAGPGPAASRACVPRPRLGSGRELP